MILYLYIYRLPGNKKYIITSIHGQALLDDYVLSYFDDVVKRRKRVKYNGIRKEDFRII